MVETVRSNAFRMTPDRSLDMVYLRVCAIYGLLKRGKIDKAQAIELSRRRIRHTHKQPPDWLVATIEIWLNGPLRNTA